MSDAIGARLQGKITLRLIVPIAIITFVNAIDRVNISYAGSAMSADLGLSPDQFGSAVSMFFLAYLLVSVCHVRLLRVWGIKRWIFVCTMLWAVSGFWMAHITSAAEFYAARFLLGMAEAGFASGMTWLISQWAPPAVRARMLGGALVAVPLSMVLGGSLCGWLLQIDNPLHMPAWRYMFLLLTIPNVVLAVLAHLAAGDDRFVCAGVLAPAADPPARFWCQRGRDRLAQRLATAGAGDRVGG